MGIREQLCGVLSDIEKQAAALDGIGAQEAAIEVRMIYSQLSLVLIEDDERAEAARLDAEAHELFVSANRLVRMAETSGQAVVERALGMITAAAMDDLEDDELDEDGNVVVRRGEDAAALLSVARMIARRSNPEAYWRQIDDDHDEHGVVIENEEAREFLVRHFEKGKRGVS